MRLYDITSKHITGTNRAVVGTLGTWEAALGPAERMSVNIQESVLLLNSKPRVRFLK